MSTRPHSLNDELPSNPNIRRDQYKRIKGIVDIHRDRPQLAFDLVRDYCKGIDKVKTCLLFPNSADEAPTEIRVIAEGSATESMSTQVLQTIYTFSFTRPEIVEPPQL
jgi:hypothetical protein